jgi:hypothetical protein
LADGLIVQRVAVSLLIKQIDHVAAWLMHDLLLEHQQELRPCSPSESKCRLMEFMARRGSDSWILAAADLVC